MKKKLRILAKDKGFTSKFLYDGEYKYAPEKEKLRWEFWLTELQTWLRDVHNLTVESKRRWKYSYVKTLDTNMHTFYNTTVNNFTVENRSKAILYISEQGHQNYFEALSDGIEFALNKLPNIDKKQKK